MLGPRPSLSDVLFISLLIFRCLILSLVLLPKFPCERYPVWDTLYIPCAWDPLFSSVPCLAGIWILSMGEDNCHPLIIGLPVIAQGNYPLFVRQLPVIAQSSYPVIAQGNLSGITGSARLWNLSLIIELLWSVSLCHNGSASLIRNCSYY